MAKSYSEKLRDPRWQKKRLEILSRDNWTCQCCSDTSSTLNVHHRHYLAGREPWDYDDKYLVALCEQCHKNETEDRPESERRLLEALRLKFLSYEVTRLAKAVEEMGMCHVEEVVMSAICDVITDPELQRQSIQDMFSRYDAMMEGFLVTEHKGS